MADLNSGNTTIRVTPEQLRAIASEAAGSISELERILQSVKMKVDVTKRYWIGEGGDVCRAQYEKQQEEVSEIIKRLKTQPKTLLTIAGVYKEKEDLAVSISAPLPDNLID